MDKKSGKKASSPFLREPEAHDPWEIARQVKAAEIAKQAWLAKLAGSEQWVQ
jgi:hypothetical protein